MTFRVNHLHFKTPDPKVTAQWYIDNLGAKITQKEGNGFLLDLHGVPIRVSGFVEGQKLWQFYGLEHIALETDDMPGTVQQLKSDGARVLEERVVGDGRKVCFFEGPQGIRLEIIERRP